MGNLIDTCPILNRLLSSPEKYVMIRIPHGRRKDSIHDIYQGTRTAWGNINVTKVNITSNGHFHSSLLLRLILIEFGPKNLWSSTWFFWVFIFSLLTSSPSSLISLSFFPHSTWDNPPPISLFYSPLSSFSFLSLFTHFSPSLCYVFLSLSVSPSSFFSFIYFLHINGHLAIILIIQSHHLLHQVIRIIIIPFSWSFTHLLFLCWVLFFI